VESFPGIVFPTGLFSDASIDKAPTDFKPLSERDTANNKIYDAELMAGAPLSLVLLSLDLPTLIYIRLQLIARKFNE
jgi:hypothetical protein